MIYKVPSNPNHSMILLWAPPCWLPALEQIQLLNRLKEIMIYWLDLMKSVIYCEPNRCTFMQI